MFNSITSSSLKWEMRLAYLCILVLRNGIWISMVFFHVLCNFHRTCKVLKVWIYETKDNEYLSFQYSYLNVLLKHYPVLCLEYLNSGPNVQWYFELLVPQVSKCTELEILMGIWDNFYDCPEERPSNSCHEFQNFIASLTTFQLSIILALTLCLEEQHPNVIFFKEIVFYNKWWISILHLSSITYTFWTEVRKWANCIVY